MFKILKPEVAGELGEQTELDISCHPPKILKLHYDFTDWLGDDILETFPCFIVTVRLQKEILKLKLTGISFDKVTISTNEKFEELNPEGLVLPKFHWLKVFGTAGVDDFGLSDNNELIISEAVWNMLHKFQISRASHKDFN